MNKKNTIDYIRPAGAFPNTPEGWKEYEECWEVYKENRGCDRQHELAERDCGAR